MIFVAVAVPHTLVTRYMIVSIPLVIPVTTPPVTDALVLLLLHTPPVTAFESVIVDPMHTPEGPVIVPAFGNGLTVIPFVAETVPHELVTE